jgi:hypothetical protein
VLRAEVPHRAWRVHHDLPLRTRFRLVAPALHASTGAVEEAALAVPGVRAARFTPETGSLLVEHDGTETTRSVLLRALEEMSAREVSVRPGEPHRCGSATAPGAAVKEAVVSLLSAALPPGPLAALRLFRSLATAGR